MLFSTVSYGYAQHAPRVMSWWAVAFPQAGHKIRPGIENEAARLYEMIPAREEKDFHTRIDGIRSYIYEHSVHLIDKEFYSYWHDIAHLMKRIRLHALDPEQNRPPHTECTTRAALMYWILKQAGIRSRIIVVYAGDDITDSHAFLEVYNPESEKWEIQDPDYNIYWALADSGARASTEDLLSHHPITENFQICKSVSECADDGRIRERLVQFFDVAAIVDTDQDSIQLMGNTNRIPANHVILHGMPDLAYCALFKGNCYNDIIFYN